jgi:hypothetical protein
MIRFLSRLVAFILAISLVACDQISGPVEVLAPTEDPSLLAAAPPPASAASVEQFDTTTPEQRAAATEAPVVAAEKQLGKTITSLGNPADPGFWLETPLVTERRPGRVVYPATGNSVAVELIPIEGPSTAGSRISLPALRLLGAPLAGLPELVVFAR